MVWILGAIIAVLSAVIIVLLAKLIILRRTVSEISDALSFHFENDTNTLIDVSSRDRKIRRLASALNIQLKAIRKEHHRYTVGDRELKESIANISHDLRTPLTAICGYLDLLENADQSENAKRYTKQIRNRTDVMKQLTEELFRYSVISSEPDMSYEKVDMCRVLEETLLSFYASFDQKNISPEISIPPRAVWRNLDSSALTRIFNNIIGNAVKYSDGDFSVTLTEEGTVTFINTAKELSSVEVGKLFDRFYTVDSARKSTGLGLSIAKLLTERMNGKIEAKYEDEKLFISVSFANNA